MITIELPAVMENLDDCLDFLVKGIKQAGIDKKTVFQLRLACEEVIVNVIHYAYPNQQGKVRISYELAEDASNLVILVSDSGVPFNPLEKSEPDISLPIEERQIGGLGIFMVRKVMDSVEYTREDGRNILTLRKVLMK